MHEKKLSSLVAAVIWAAGVQPSPLTQMLKTSCQARLDENDRVYVDTYCWLPSDEKIFIIGDMAHFRDECGEPLPGIASTAMQQGKFVVRTLKRRLKNKPLPYFRYRNCIFMTLLCAQQVVNLFASVLILHTLRQG